MSDYVEDSPARRAGGFGSARRTERLSILGRAGVLPGRPAAAPASEGRATSGARLGRRLIRPERVGLALILAVSAALNLYGLANAGYANTYYAAAVRSMLESWHNFFFVSFDPGGFVTVDKPPLGFMIQTISAKIFGFHGWSILLPQALAGIASVALLYWLVRRVWGPTAGLVAAAVLAVTPISVVTNRNNTIDSLLALTSLGAVWATMRAIESVRYPLRWLTLAAVLVGLGFNIKMLEAFLILPAIWLAYLLVSRARLFPRLAHLVLATIVVVAVSLSWAIAVDLTPASERPYVGSSQTNSVLELALGYNGLQRLLGRGDSVDTLLNSSSGGGPMGGGGGGVGGVSENGEKGLLRLINEQLGGQIGWFVPFAVVGLAAAAWTVRPRRVQFWRFATSPRGAGVLRRRRASTIVWGTWFLTMGAFFSIAGFYHRYYLTMLAPGVAALVGIGVAALWAAWRLHGAAGLFFWGLPAAIVGTALVQHQILGDYPEWSARLTPVIVALGIVAVTVFVLARALHSRAGRTAIVGTFSARLALAIGIVALLVAPTAWSALSVQAGGGGNLPVAGPAGSNRMGGPGGGGVPGGMQGMQGRGGQGFPTGGAQAPAGGQAAPGQMVPGASGMTPGGQAGAATERGTRGNAGQGGYAVVPGGAQPGAAEGQQPTAGRGQAGNFMGALPGGDGGRGGISTAMLDYLVANRGDATFILAVGSSMEASSTIISTGLPIMATGGFSGSDPILTAESLTQLVEDGTVRFFLGGGNGGFGGRGGSFSVSNWVAQNCTAVPASAYGATTGNSQFYDCAAAK